jgi:uncharacterized protein
LAIVFLLGRRFPEQDALQLDADGISAFALCLLAAMLFGYAAQKGGFCVVRGIADILERRSIRTFMSFFKCSLWVCLVSWPLWWLFAGVHPASTFPLTLESVIGGLTFGIGAAINGGCSFGAFTRLAAGDLSFVVSFVAMAIGLAIQHEISWSVDVANVMKGSVIARPGFGPFVLYFVVVGVCAREVALLARAGRGQGIPEKAAVLVGICGALLYAFRGSWIYALDPGRLIEASGATQDWDIASLSAAMLVGAGICAVREGSFRLQASWRALPFRFGGGVLMGYGVALVPGGNGTLILEGIPALSPHAIPAYAALAMGSAVMLLGSRTLRLLARGPRQIQ